MLSQTKENQNNPKPKLAIGVLSGIGPLAGADILMRIIAYSAHTYGAHNDEDYPDIYFLNHGIPGVDNTASLDSTFRDGVVSGINTLEEWGASIIGVACNTAHSYFENITVQPTTTLINLIDEVSRRAQKNAVTYGLLTSRGTAESLLYANSLSQRAVDFISASEEQQQLLDKAIDCIMAHKKDAAARSLKKVIDDFKSKGITHFIAGCTELPIAIEEMDEDDILVISSSQVLAEKLVDSYYAREKNQV